MTRRALTAIAALTACASASRGGDSLKPSAFVFAKPEGAFAFDLGAREGEAVPGFDTVPFDRTFRDGFGMVWPVGQTAVINAADRRTDAGYPTMLEGAGVLAQEGRTYTFACEVPNGRYAATAYMGGMPKSSIANFNHMLVVNGKRAVNDERSIHDLVQQEFSCHVEATLVTSADLQEPGRRIYDLYMRPIWKRHVLSLDLRLLPLPASLKPGELTLAIRVLSDDLSKVVKQDALLQLRADSFRLVLNVADLPPGQYVAEFLLKDAQSQSLTRVERPLEVIPQGL